MAASFRWDCVGRSSEPRVRTSARVVGRERDPSADGERSEAGAGPRDLGSAVSTKTERVRARVAG